MTFIAFKELLI